ncbi:haloacid dehalogenase-like hydrolase [Floricoccus penangensis]|uniref:haloacid dehalogenase-like hydrolase n=1 Tax=Floricoccus penangensis TaxID=1859475 RepID=UPI0020415214|nr:haloacid dehalogenase-like hydrolase [Floricoccus penangensis]URZ86584.1 haloacid dehalogenase-like hydrolase [Floricoccus penangensis]
MKKENWYPANFKRLEKLIRENGIDSPNYNPQNKPYAVFDWDNTSIINDVEEATLTYQIENLAFKFTTNQLEEILAKSILESPESSNLELQSEKIQIEKICKDVVDDYSKLLDLKKNASLNDIHETDYYKDFSAKLRYLYTAINKAFGTDISIYLYAGMTSAEAGELVEKAIDDQLQRELKHITWSSPEDMETSSGMVQVTFKDGIRVIEEMRDLYQELMAKGIDVYICSASYIDVIKVFANNEKYGYNIPLENVFAMRLVKDNGVIEAKFDENYPKTVKKGKVETIEKLISPKYNGAQPILVAGDSNGDYPMLTEFTDLQVGIIHNIGVQGLISDLTDEVMEAPETENQKYLLQGRDENKGILISSKTSIFLDK